MSMWDKARNIEDVLDGVPTCSCPKCRAGQIDLDGFGFLHCTECGYCTHPSITDGVCGLCGAAVTVSATSEGK